MRLEDMRAEGTAHGDVSVHADRASLRATERTDWFFSPTGTARSANVPRLVWEVSEPIFSLSARVSVEFASAYDAGAVFIEADADNWAKIAFEYSAAHNPTIVSVVTRSTSDDSDGPVFAGASAYLRLYCDGQSIAFHFSEDGKFWRFLRWFSIPGLDTRPIKVGLGAQSPTGKGTTAVFEDVRLDHATISNLRDGQ